MAVKKVLALSLFTTFVIAGTLSSSLYAAEPATDKKPEEVVKTLRFSALDAEYVRRAGIYGKFIRLLDNPGALAPETLNDISFEVRAMAFYRTSDRQNKRLPKTLYDTLEQKMINKFSAVRRFEVHECLECKTTRVVLKDNQFSILRQLESNANLKKVANDIGVDHFLMWEAYSDQGQAVINMRIVAADKGQVRWSRQYRSGGVDHEVDREFYTSFWGINATRKSTGAGKNVSVSPLIALGFRMLSRSTVSNRIYFGYGIEFFTNTTESDFVSALGITINARLAYEIDSFLSLTKKNYGNWLLYTSVGQAFIITTPSIVGRFGLEVRPTERSYIDIGAIYFDPRKFTTFTKAGYEDQAGLGGIGYDITLGVRF